MNLVREDDMVVVSHLGVPCRSKQEADLFFTRLLGLPHQRTFQVTSEIASRIFHVSGDVEVHVYDDGVTRIEAFVTTQPYQPVYTHIGVEVVALPGFLDRCRQHGLECLSIPRGDKQLHFVLDFAGNLYELTEQ